MCQFRKFRVLLVCTFVCCAWAAVANATYLTSDGDLQGQATDGTTVVGSPGWGPDEGRLYGGANSQSPFTNAFANNGIGMHGVGSATATAYWSNKTNSPISSIATGTLYYNADFQIDSTNSVAGDFNFTITNYYTPHRTLGMWVAVHADHSTYFYADNGPTGTGNTSIFSPVAGQWYNVQLALNMGTDTYSGAVYTDVAGTISKVADISSRAFYSNDYIDRIASEDDLSGSGIVGVLRLVIGHSLDNLVLSDSFIPSPIPEPGTLVLMATGLFGLLAYAWRKRR